MKYLVLKNTTVTNRKSKTTNIKSGTFFHIRNFQGLLSDRLIGSKPAIKIDIKKRTVLVLVTRLI